MTEKEKNNLVDFGNFILKRRLEGKISSQNYFEVTDADLENFILEVTPKEAKFADILSTIYKEGDKVMSVVDDSVYRYTGGMTIFTDGDIVVKAVDTNNSLLVLYDIDYGLARKQPIF